MYKVCPSYGQSVLGRSNSPPYPEQPAVPKARLSRSTSDTWLFKATKGGTIFVKTFVSSIISIWQRQESWHLKTCGPGGWGSPTGRGDRQVLLHQWTQTACETGGMSGDLPDFGSKAPSESGLWPSSLPGPQLCFPGARSVLKQLNGSSHRMRWDAVEYWMSGMKLFTPM